MMELRQGQAEAFVFRSWGKVALKPGRTAGFTIPSHRALFVSRYLNLAVLLVLLTLFFRHVQAIAVVEAIWAIQALHLAVKVGWLWKPVRFDAGKPVTVLAPRLSLLGEHSMYLATIAQLCVVSSHQASSTWWIWAGLSAATLVAILLTSLVNRVSSARSDRCLRAKRRG